MIGGGLGSFAGRDGREMGGRIMAVWVGWVAGVGSQREFWGLRADSAGLRGDSAGTPRGFHGDSVWFSWGLRGDSLGLRGTPRGLRDDPRGTPQNAHFWKAMHFYSVAHLSRGTPRRQGARARSPLSGRAASF